MINEVIKNTLILLKKNGNKHLMKNVKLKYFHYINDNNQ